MRRKITAADSLALRRANRLGLKAELADQPEPREATELEALALALYLKRALVAGNGSAVRRWVATLARRHAMTPGDALSFARAFHPALTAETWAALLKR